MHFQAVWLGSTKGAKQTSPGQRLGFEDVPPALKGHSKNSETDYSSAVE